jgi:hypothetical protein
MNLSEILVRQCSSFWECQEQIRENYIPKNKEQIDFGKFLLCHSTASRQNSFVLLLLLKHVKSKIYKTNSVARKSFEVFEKRALRRLLFVKERKKQVD